MMPAISALSSANARHAGRRAGPDEALEIAVDDGVSKRAAAQVDAADRVALRAVAGDAPAPRTASRRRRCPRRDTGCRAAGPGPAPRPPPGRSTSPHQRRRHRVCAWIPSSSPLLMNEARMIAPADAGCKADPLRSDLHSLQACPVRQVKNLARRRSRPAGLKACTTSITTTALNVSRFGLVACTNEL